MGTGRFHIYTESPIRVPCLQTRKGEATYAFVFFGDLDEAQLEHSFKEPSTPI